MVVIDSAAAHQGWPLRGVPLYLACYFYPEARSNFSLALVSSDVVGYPNKNVIRTRVMPKPMFIQLPLQHAFPLKYPKFRGLDTPIVKIFST